MQGGLNGTKGCEEGVLHSRSPVQAAVYDSTHKQLKDTAIPRANETKTVHEQFVYKVEKDNSKECVVECGVVHVRNMVND